MKILAIIIIVLSIGETLVCQPTNTDFLDYDYKINGNVNSILEESFLLNSDKIIVEKKWDTKWENDKSIYFDELNYVTKIEYLDASGKVLRSDLFRYENGNITLRKLKYSTEIHFYENGVLDEIYSEVSQPKMIKTGFEKPTPNSYESKLKHIYENDQLKNVIMYNSRGEKECIANLKYDTSTKQLIEMENNCDGLIEKYEYKYSDENLIQIKWSDNEEGLIEQSDYKYDQDKVIEESWKLYDGGEYSGKVVTKYDNYNEVEVTESNENDEIDYMIRFEYEFDDHGNWIKKYVIKEDENYLITRQIKY